MSTTAPETKTRAAKPWDKLRRHVRPGRSASQPSSPTPSIPASPNGADEAPGPVLREMSGLNVSPSGDGAGAVRGSPQTAVSAMVKGTEPVVRGSGVPSARARGASDASPAVSKAPKRMVIRGSKMVEASDDGSPDPAHARPEENARNPAASSPPADAEGDKAFEWLLQRQIEVEMSLRGCVLASQADVIRVGNTFATFVEFFAALDESAAMLGDQTRRRSCTPSELFQELLHRVAGINAGVSMDEQRRDGNVPMHQAKVLDRRDRVCEAVADADETLGEERITWLVACVREMRLLLRVKMEDANDVRMAEEAVTGANDFFVRLRRLAEDRNVEDYAVLEELRSA